MIRSYLLLIVCVSFWGSNFVFGAILVQEFPPMLLTASRLLFINLFLYLFAYYSKKFSFFHRKDWWLILLLGLIGTSINQWTFYAGMETADPTTAALILALAPITTALLAAYFLKERLTLKLIVGSLVAFAGVFYVLTSGENVRITEGIAWIFLTMFSFSLSIIIVRKMANAYDPVTITLYSNLIGFGSLLPIALIKESVFEMTIEIWAWALLIATAILMHGICTLVWNRQIQMVGAAKAAMFLNLEPFIAMLVGYIILNKKVNGTQLIGASLVIMGVYMATSFKSHKNKAKQINIYN